MDVRFDSTAVDLSRFIAVMHRWFIGAIFYQIESCMWDTVVVHAENKYKFWGYLIVLSTPPKNNHQTNTYVVGSRAAHFSNVHSFCCFLR